LNTGACLVDLPGVRDANVARARVAESYLQHCHAIWIVAPIQRAVDDGTAKELLGRSFQRRLLMDGAYGNVSFVCTQTDDCEPTETMRDHANVAKKMGLWHDMRRLHKEIKDLDKPLAELQQQEEDLLIQLEEATEAIKESEEELQEARQEIDEYEGYSDEEDDKVAGNQEILHLQRIVNENRHIEQTARAKLESWREANATQMAQWQDQMNTLQRQLKSFCARVRNQYSTVCLQEDFRAGLRELTHKDEEEMEEDDEEDDDELAKINVDDYLLEVFCISANDYLKVAKIKPSSDGPAQTFTNVDDTQIPALRAFVHQITALRQKAFFEDFVHTTSDFIDRVKLVATNANDSVGSRMAHKCRAAFDEEMDVIAAQLHPIVSAFQTMLRDRVRLVLQPSLEKGAEAAKASALAISESWGSPNRRTRMERSPEQNGLVRCLFLICPSFFSFC